MKRIDLIRSLRKEAKVRNLHLVELREGGNHTQFRIGNVTISVPRHREIRPATIRLIERQLQGTFGKGWLIK